MLDTEWRDLKLRSLTADLQNTIGSSGRLAFQNGGYVRFAGEHIIYALNATPAYAEIAHVYNGANYRLGFNRSGTILPATDTDYNLGSSSKRWQNAWVHTVTGGVDMMSRVCLLPTARTAIAQNCRYDAGTDVLEIYDGAGWNPH